MIQNQRNVTICFFYLCNDLAKLCHISSFIILNQHSQDHNLQQITPLTKQNQETLYVSLSVTSSFSRFSTNSPSLCNSAWKHRVEATLFNRLKIGYCKGHSILFTFIINSVPLRAMDRGFVILEKITLISIEKCLCGPIL